MLAADFFHVDWALTPKRIDVVFALYYSRGFTEGCRLRPVSSCPSPVRGYAE